MNSKQKKVNKGEWLLLSTWSSRLENNHMYVYDEALVRVNEMMEQPKARNPVLNGIRQSSSGGR